MIKGLELEAGSRSIGKEAEKLGMRVFSSDIEPFDNIDYVVDIFNFDYAKVPFIPDFIWASPPCQGFSVAAIGKNWVSGEPFTPKTESAKLGIRLLKKNLEIIEHYLKLNPNLIFWFENPRGKMRKAPFLEHITRHTVTYCQYELDKPANERRMKPTDIWTNSKTWVPRTMCKNGDPCHIAAPRGSKTGTQGLKGSYERSKLPPWLCIEILKSLL